MMTLNQFHEMFLSVFKNKIRNCLSISRNFDIIFKGKGCILCNLGTSVTNKVLNYGVCQINPDTISNDPKTFSALPTIALLVPCLLGMPIKRAEKTENGPVFRSAVNPLNAVRFPDWRTEKFTYLTAVQISGLESNTSASRTTLL